MHSVRTFRAPRDASHDPIDQPEASKILGSDEIAVVASRSGSSKATTAVIHRTKESCVEVMMAWSCGAQHGLTASPIRASAGVRRGVWSCLKATVTVFQHPFAVIPFANARSRSA